MTMNLGRTSSHKCCLIHNKHNMIMKFSPGKLVFGHDVILPIAHIYSWKKVKNYEQTPIDKKM